MNEYIELLDELCVKCDSGELTEEGVNDVLAEVVISERKVDPRPVNRPADILKEIEAHTNSGKPLVRLEPLIEDCDDLTGEPDEQTDSLN